ncbi:hypothetical protein RUM43_002781 [Polyplax serrata]|uniref:Uncharacterized protein n=1 Tax=Polyplax serrata TaxID=468196 RepID=A0AAN8NU41_POLSC
MTEKAASKKDSQKKNKNKKSEQLSYQDANKYKSVKNIPNQKNKVKKVANGKKRNGEHTSSNNGKSAPLCKRFFQLFIIPFICVSLFMGFLYVVDYEKYTQIRGGVGVLFDKAISILPEGVVTYGRKFADAVKPVGNFCWVKASYGLSQVSHFLSTNPLIKDHWLTIREINKVCSAHVVDYIRTLYLQVTGFFHNTKSKLF